MCTTLSIYYAFNSVCLGQIIPTEVTAALYDNILTERGVHNVSANHSSGQTSLPLSCTIPTLNMLRSILSRGNAASQRPVVACARPTKAAAVLSAAKAMQHQSAAVLSEYDALRARQGCAADEQSCVCSTLLFLSRLAANMFLNTVRCWFTAFNRARRVGTLRCGCCCCCCRPRRRGGGDR